MNGFRAGLLSSSLRNSDLAATAVHDLDQRSAEVLGHCRSILDIVKADQRPADHDTHCPQQVTGLLDWRHEDGTSLLHLTAGQGDSHMLSTILASGCDVNSKDKDGFTPLMIATLKHCGSAVEILARHSQCDVNLQSRNLGAALHIAVLEKQDDIVTSLLGNGANCNLVGPEGCTPLYLSAARGSCESLCRLLEAGADMSITSDVGLSPLHAAAMEDRLDKVLQLLKRGAMVGKADSMGNLPLHYAARTGNQPLIGALITAGSPLNVMNRSFETPLHIAIREGNLDTMKQLINAGSDVNIRRPDGNGQPLHLLVTVYSATYPAKFCDVLDLFLKAGCDLNTPAYCTLETPLYRAITMQRSDVADALIRRGANPNLSSPFDITALHVACRNKDFHLVNLLVHAGINWKRERWIGKVSFFQTCDSPDIWNLVTKWRTEPLSLENLSRIAMRQHWKDDLCHRLRQLKAPHSVKNFIMFSDIPGTEVSL